MNSNERHTGLTYLHTIIIRHKIVKYKQYLNTIKAEDALPGFPAITIPPSSSTLQREAGTTLTALPLARLDAVRLRDPRSTPRRRGSLASAR